MKTALKPSLWLHLNRELIPQGFDTTLLKTAANAHFSSFHNSAYLNFNFLVEKVVHASGGTPVNTTSYKEIGIKIPKTEEFRALRLCQKINTAKNGVEVSLGFDPACERLSETTLLAILRAQRTNTPIVASMLDTKQLFPIPGALLNVSDTHVEYTNADGWFVVLFFRTPILTIVHYYKDGAWRSNSMRTHVDKSQLIELCRSW